jgi:hypothetical protein
MAKFKVEVTETLKYREIIEVDADTERDAEIKAMEAHKLSHCKETADSGDIDTKIMFLEGAR